MFATARRPLRRGPVFRGAVPLVVLVACSRDPEPQGGGPEASAEVVPPVLPTLTVTTPERGAFVAEGALEVAGQAVAGDAALSTLTLNDAEVALDGGGQPGARATFATTLATEPGINILGFRVDDAAGERAIDGRAVYAGPLLDPGATVEGGMRMQIGPELLDDDDPDLDDVAAIVEVVLGDPAIASAMVGTPFESDYFVLTPTSLSWTGASVDIDPGDAGLAVSLTLTDLWMDFDVEGTGWYDWLGTSGSAWADAVTIRTTLVATGGGGGIVVTPTGTTATLDGYGVTVDWFPDSLEGYLADWTQGTIEEQLVAAVDDTLGALVGDYLSSFVADLDLTERVRLSMALADVDSADDGLRLKLDVAATATAGIDLPAGAGSAHTAGAPPDWPLAPGEPFAVACDDDFVNELLFAFWASGALGGLEFSGTEIGGMSGQELPAPLGPVERASLDLGLPPAVLPASSDDQDADFAIGEFRLDFLREDGELNAFSVNVRTGLTVDIDEDGALALTLDGRPSYMQLEIGTVAWTEGLDPGDLAALVRLIVPPILTNASRFLPAIAIPGIPLDAFSDAPELAGKELRFTDPTLLVDDGRWVVFGASAEVR